MDRYFYSVEMDGGRKVIHLFGNVYFNDVDETDKCYRHAEWCGFYMSVDKMNELFANGEFYYYINEKVAYLGDLTEDEAIEVCRNYFNGEPGKMLRIEQHQKSIFLIRLLQTHLMPLSTKKQQKPTINL